MRLFTRAFSQLLDLLAPPGCAACDAPSRATFCARCGAPAAVPSARRVAGVPLLSAGLYAPPLSEAIVRFKYGGRAELASALAELLAPSLDSLTLPAGTTLVPVPLHPRRLAARGYNQAALLARELGRARKLPHAPRLLRRTRDTEQQVGKSRALRLANTSDAFVLRQSGPRTAILVDDVVTTGATVRACAETLALGGIEVVAVAALAEAVDAPG